MEHSFGAIFQEPDPRDYKLEMVGASTSIPETYRTDVSLIPVYYQGKQPACGSHAGATLKAIQEKGDTSPRYLWEGIKDVDGYPIEVGTDMYSIFRVLRDKGVCDFNLTGNDVKLSLQDYRNLKVTPEMNSNASHNKIESYAITTSPTFEQIKKAIYLNGAIIIQYRCGPNMYLPSWTTCLPLSPDKYPMDSGHFVIGIGYDKDYIYFRNSWSTDWGVKGDGYFGADYVKWVYAIGTALDKSQITPDVLPKYAFTRDLTIGSRGNDVKALQKLLEATGDLVMPTGVAYGYFGFLTKASLAKFQKRNGINPPAGYFGPITKKYIAST